MMIRRVPRFRLTRFSLITTLLSLFGVYYLFFAAPAQLPEELLSSPIYHPAGEATPSGGRWARGRQGNGGGGGRGEEIGLAYSPDGLVRGWEAAHELIKRAGILPKRERKRVKEVRDTHPIEELMKRGKEKWEALLKR